MKASVRVFQLESDNAYLNVDNEFVGGISVWTYIWKRKCILAQDGYHLYFFLFDNDEYYNEWVEEHSNSFDKITLIEGIEK